jgi:hypothetical protein
LAGGAVLTVIVVFPIFHEHARDLMALRFEQVGGDGGINPTTEADDGVFLNMHNDILKGLALTCLLLAY